MAWLRVAGGSLKEGAGESKTKLEERCEYKLTKEKRSDKQREGGSSSAVGRRAGNPFVIADADRMCFQLYRLEKGGGVNWLKVDV